jgi:hypothetical protein
MPKTVALIGLDTSQIDFSNPDYSHFAHIGAEGIKSLLEKDKAKLIALGFDAELVFTAIDASAAGRGIKKALESRSWDCILIGNGVRSIPSNFLLFELLINMIVEFAPNTKVCFNTKPDDSVDAVLRWVSP